MKKKILVIDDEAGLTRMLKRGLEATGKYEVREVNLPAKALEAAREFKPDLMFLDVMMPDVDGGSVAAEFAETNDLKHVPIVFLTAAISQKEAGPTGTSIGTHTYLSKPVDLKNLIKCIEDHIGS